MKSEVYTITELLGQVLDILQYLSSSNYAKVRHYQ